MQAKFSRIAILASVVALIAVSSGCSTGESDSSSPQPVNSSTVQAPASTKSPQPTTSSTATEHSTTTPLEQSTPAAASFPAGMSVDSSNFQQGEGHYWTSPSGRIYCGVQPTPEYMLAGCQMASALPECGPDYTSSAPLVQFAERAILTRTCTTQGIFVREDDRVLEYGQQIDVGPFTAVSQPDGMYMRHRETGEAFSIAIEGIQTFKTAV